jgi:hypothetical protein
MGANGARSGRDAWVSYLRVSTPEQADSELSLLAQRRSTEAYARQHDRTIVREYVEAGCSGDDHEPEGVPGNAPGRVATGQRR